MAITENMLLQGKYSCCSFHDEGHVNYVKACNLSNCSLVWAHNKKTGQTFRTKKDLLRYVHYAENVLPFLPINKNVPYQDYGASSDSKGKAVDAGESAKATDDKEGNLEQLSEGEDGNSEEAYDDDDDDDEDDDGSLYGGLDFSKGIWGIKNVEIIERSSSHAPVTATDIQNTHKNQQAEGTMKVQDDQLPETTTKTVTEHRRNKRPRKKFEMPPKRFRGLGKNHRRKP